MKPRPMTLAGRIVEFDRLSDKDKMQAHIATSYETTCLKEGPLSPSAKKLFNLLQQVKSPSFRARDNQELFQDAFESARFFATHLAASARFQLTSPIVAQMLRMADNLPIEKILEHFDKAVPPFNKTWFEYSRQEHDEEYGTPYNAQVGFLVDYKKGEGINLRKISYIDPAPSSPLFPHFETVTVINKDTILATPYSQQKNQEDAVDSMVRMAKIALCAFLLMNSRSKVIQAGTEVRARGKLGYIEPVGLRPITFDLSRIIKNRPGISQEEAKRILAEQMVRGHFKVRKTGVFFWSPYVRNIEPGSTPEEAWSRQLKRDRTDVIQHLDRPLVLPTGATPPGL